jgi:hypothetical protein
LLAGAPRNAAIARILRAAAPLAGELRAVIAHALFKGIGADKVCAPRSRIPHSSNTYVFSPSPPRVGSFSEKERERKKCGP